MTKTAFRFRGVAGILLMALGISLSVIFKKSSGWPADVKMMVIAVAYCASIGGAGLFGSYAQQLAFHQMKNSLLYMGLVLAIMLLTAL